MATVNDVLRIAASQIGYSRWNDPKEGTKYGRWYAEITHSPYFGTNGVPYCAMGVSWTLNQAGQTVAGFPTASCLQAKSGASRAGLIISNKHNAQPGDLVLFDWDPARGNGVDHVGFIEKNLGSYVQTIEFNTSSGVSGSQSNGGGVYRRTRDWSVVDCIIRPSYNGGRPTPPDPPAPHHVTVDGYFGHDSVKELQYQLGTPQDGFVSGQYAGNSLYFPRLMSVQYGAGGSQMIMKLQKKVGATVDGVIGKDTVKCIQLWLKEICGYQKHAVDGYLGSDTAANMQNALNAGYFKSKPARKPAASNPPALGGLGCWGVQMTKELQRQLGTKVDGTISQQSAYNKRFLPNAAAGWEFVYDNPQGSKCIIALQKRLGTPADGFFGQASVKALQSFLRKKGYDIGKDGIDGYLGAATCGALGHALQDKLF